MVTTQSGIARTWVTTFSGHPEPAVFSQGSEECNPGSGENKMFHVEEKEGIAK